MSIAGDPHSIQKLYSGHHTWLRGWLYRRVNNHCDAADLSQDTFLRLLTSTHPAAELREPRAYLATVANRLLINLYRRRSLERAYLEALATLPEDQAPSAEHQCAMLEALNAVDEVLAGLPGKVRQAFLMYQLEGCSQEEIAEAMAINVRSVRRYLTRALEECIVLVSSEWL